MPCLGIVRYGEGEVRSTRGGAEFVDGLIAVRVEASTFGGREGGVFNPELEATVGADGGYEVWVDCWGEPLDLWFGVGSVS